MRCNICALFSLLGCCIFLALYYLVGSPNPWLLKWNKTVHMLYNCQNWSHAHGFSLCSLPQCTTKRVSKSFIRLKIHGMSTWTHLSWMNGLVEFSKIMSLIEPYHPLQPVDAWIVLPPPLIRKSFGTTLVCKQTCRHSQVVEHTKGHAHIDMDVVEDKVCF